MKITDIIGRLCRQISSGRWIITIAATYCLIKLTQTLCTLMLEGKVVLETATYVAICMSVLNTVGMVTVFYFNKNRSYEENGDNDDHDTSTSSSTK